MVSSKTIKSTARTNLRGNWSQACVVAIVLLSAVFVSLLLGELVIGVFKSVVFGTKGEYTLIGFFVALAVSMCTFVLSLPVIQGVIRWFWALIIDSELPLSELFYYYSSPKLFSKTLMLYVRVIVRYIVTAVICFAPSVAIWLAGENALQKLREYANALPLFSVKPIAVFFAVIGLIFFLKFAFKTSFSMVLIVIDERLDYIDAILLSKKICAKKRFLSVYIFLSYFGWLLVSLLGITMLYTLPFMLCSYVVSARFAITNYRIENKITDMDFIVKN